MRGRLGSALAGLCVLSACAFLQAEEPQDSLTLPNGDRVSGTWQKTEEGLVYFHSPYLGDLVVAAEAVTLERGATLLPEGVAPPAPAPTPAPSAAAPPPWYAFWEQGLWKKPEHWTGKFFFSYKILWGVQQKKDLYGDLTLHVQRPADSFDWRAMYDYTTHPDRARPKTVDRYELSLRYRRSLCERTFIQSFSFVGADRMKSLDRDLRQSLGYGYALLRGERVNLNIVPGLALRHTATQADEGSHTLYDFYQDLDWKIRDNLQFRQSLSLFAETAEVDDFNLLFKASLETALTKVLSLRLAYELAYENQPERGIEKEDARVITALGFTF